MIPKSPGRADFAKEEISVLIETLLDTEKRLEELTLGEVDTVAGQDGRTFMLGRAQEQSRHSEMAKQAAILNALAANIALLDNTGVIISVNEAWRRFANANVLHAAGHGIGLNYLDICDTAVGEHADDAHRVGIGIRAVLSGSAPSFSVEYPCHSPTEKRWFLLTANPLTEHQGTGAVVMHLNITGRILAHEALHASLEEFRTLTEAMPQMVWVTRTDGKNTHFNKQWFDYTGLSLEESIGNGWSKPFHPEDQTRAKLAWDQATSDRSTYSIEARIRRADGA